MIVDGHEDIAPNVLLSGRDFTRSVAENRAREGDEPLDGICSLALPELLQAGVGLVFGTLFTLPATAKLPSVLEHKQNRAYQTIQQAHDMARRQLDYYYDLTARDDVRLVTNRAELQQLRTDWQAGVDPQTGKSPLVGIVPLIENADPVRTPDEVAWWYEQGVRLIGPAWQANRYTGGTSQPGPLTDLGRALLNQMADVGMILDTSHLAEESFWQALDRYEGVLIASHSNCRRLAPAEVADRHLSDRMIEALVERDAVIGVVLLNGFLNRSYYLGQPKDQTPLEMVVRHIDHICQIAGDAAHVAIGSDLDGGFGSEKMPRELDSVADLPKVGAALREHGYTDEHIAAIMGGNWLRTLERGLPA